MGKSSSSRKKKRSDASPLARKRKNKSKRTGNKSKKLRRRHDSDSYSSDYDSAVSSYSISVDDYKRRRRSRSPTRGSKRRNRRRSYSSECSEESRRSRKRKRSKRNDNLGARGKSYKKKPKRRAVSSTSSGSMSCSTCDGGSEFVRRRGRSRRRDEHDWHAGNDKTAAERSRYRSGSCSSTRGCSMSSGDQNAERTAVVNSSMRLKSVIMVIDKAEERNLERDEQKEEILYDKDDYPSPRSNDSNDGGSKREMAHQSSGESKMKGQVGSEEFAEAAALETGSTGVVGKSEARRDQLHASNPSSDVASSLNTAKQEKIAVSDDAVTEDLESVLRRKALENLKRFRRIDKGSEASDHRDDNNDVKQTLIVTTESALTITTPSEEKTTSIRRRLSTTITSIDGNTGGKEREAAGSSSNVRGSVQVTGGFIGGNLNHAGGFPSNKPRVTPFTWRRDSAKTDVASKELPRLPMEQAQAKLLETEVAANSAILGTFGDKSSCDGGVNNQCGSAAPRPSLSSCSVPVSRETSSADKVKDEANEGSQYEQKTMSVTRGGETIQVSYQVYIPKRAPALARRQLKR